MNIKDLLKDAYKEGMTIDEINKALESISLPADNSAEIEKLKAALSKSNSEAADYKKQLREKMSAEEAKAKEEAERMAEIQNKYEALLKESEISKNKARLLGLGYEDKLASETADAIVNGDSNKVFENQKKHLEMLEKRIREEVLKSTPRPAGGNTGKAITKEQFENMGYSERVKLYEENPEIYKEYTGGNE